MRARWQNQSAQVEVETSRAEAARRNVDGRQLKERVPGARHKRLSQLNQIDDTSSRIDLVVEREITGNNSGNDKREGATARNDSQMKQTESDL